MYSYANTLRTGSWIPDNKQEVAHFYKNSNASFVYAVILKFGDGVSSNKQESVCYFRMAADNGDAKMKILYANMLNIGDGVQVNEQEKLSFTSLPFLQFMNMKMHSILFFINIKKWYIFSMHNDDERSKKNAKIKKKKEKLLFFIIN